jgi:hypothetical protein
MKRDYRASPFAIAFVLALGLGLRRCATTRVEATWSNLEYAGRVIRGKMLVIGVTRDATVRRLYEDAMAVRLRAIGVDVVRSYDLVGARLSDSDGSVLLGAAKQAGVTRMLSTALVSRTHVQRVEVDTVPPPVWTYFGWYDYYWPYGYVRTETHESDRYIASTTLTEVNNGKIYWSARTRSDAAGRIETEINDVVSVTMDALSRSRLL